MEITNNGYTVKTKNVDGQHVIPLAELIKLDGHSVAAFYKMLKKNYILQKYKRQLKEKRGTAFTLEGCIKICEMFKEPNDELINKIKGFIVKPELIEIPAQKLDAEQLVDIELERQRQNKVKEEILKADNRAKIDMILQRVKSIEIKVGNIADKVFNEKKEEKQDVYLRALFKECMKEIIREELLK